jgi:pimeloyl-ACP methyl ester carboxylesterase
MTVVAGPADAPAIVFVHGTRVTHAVWRPQMERLGGEFRTVAIDLPGHGERAGEPFTLSGAAAVVRRAIDEEAGGRAVVVGLSLGGYVAMDLAARAPERVRGLVLAGATAEPAGLARAPFLVFAWGLSTFSGAGVNTASRWYFERRFPPAIAGPIVAAGFWPTGGAEAVRAVAHERFLPRIAAYPGPTLLLNGEWDVPFRVGAGRFAAAATHPRRVVIRRASHLSNLERPGAFTAAIRAFMSSLDRTP